MNEAQEQLDWLAFRYVADELDAAEAGEFELRLSTDQAAREAVARAVEETTRIHQALAGQCVVTVASRQSNWGREKARVAVVAIASCLTLLLALCLVRSFVPNTGNVARQPDEIGLSISPAQLASAWAEARTGSAALQPAFDAELTETLDAVLSGPVDSDPESSLIAPSWMLAALARVNGGIDSNRDIEE